MKGLILFIAAINIGLSASNPIVNISYEVEPLLPGPLGSQRCMTDLGCFKMTEDFFHPMYRPINFLPEDRVVVGTEFHLYTKEYPMELQLVKHNDIDSMTEIDASRQTVFITHGFIDNKLYSKWMENLKNQILLTLDYNVFIVDWSRGNMFPYTRATANSRVVGAEIALMIQSLQKNKGLDPMKVHIVGHSLGAHIAGYAGQRLEKLGRITGLDPAAPYFQYMPTSVRLDPTDADFVDVIHTDSIAHMVTALGMVQSCGHVDFYPNNGMKQPGCKEEIIKSIFLEGLVDASKRFVSCSHQRATDYFVDSINYKRVQPIGIQCSSWQHYLEGKCSDCGNGQCAIMGMQADQYKPYKNDQQSVKMYLSTSIKSPFWVSTYHVTIKLQKPSNDVQGRHGSINLLIKGSQYKYNLTTTATKLMPGNYMYLVRQLKPLGEIKELTFTWTSSELSMHSPHAIHLEYVIIKPMNTVNGSKQKLQTKKFCKQGMKALNSNTVAQLILC